MDFGLKVFLEFGILEFRFFCCDSDGCYVFELMSLVILMLKLFLMMMILL